MNKLDLAQEITRFKQWAQSRSLEQNSSAEWECEYLHWDALHEAFADHLHTVAPGKWSAQDRELLLYALARDNENEIHKGELESRPLHLLELTKAALMGSSERDAKWQLAHALGKLSGQRQEALDLLDRLVEDLDEYVSRRALTSLGLLKSPKIEAYVQRAWATNQEYQRIASLQALKDSDSPLLQQYLQLALEDGRNFLKQCAEKLQKK